MRKAELTKRYLLFVVSLFFIGFGISLTKHAGLGTSTISSMANVFSIRFPILTFGTWTILSNLFFLLCQILILRRRFRPVQLLQVPLSFLFGFFTDLGLWIADIFPNDTLVAKLILVAAGNFVLAFGIVLSITADVLLNAPEGFVKALADTLKRPFSGVKLAFDIVWVFLAAVLSVIFFRALQGVGIGTVLGAFLVGFFVKLLTRPVKHACRRLLKLSAREKQSIGLASVSFRACSPEQILKTMRQCGLSYIEWGSDIHAVQDDPEALKQLAALQARYGVTCCSYGTYFRIGTTPVEELETYISAAKTLGTTVLRIWCGDKNSGEYTEKEKTDLFCTCRTLAEIARKHGVILCMECHGGTFTDRPDGALSLMQAVDSPHFRMYWQPNQFCSLQENMAYAAAIAPYTVNIHVFNWEGDGRYPLQEAAENWRKYLSCFDRRQILLLEFMPDDRIESLQAEGQALKEIAK